MEGACGVLGTSAGTGPVTVASSCSSLDIAPVSNAVAKRPREQEQGDAAELGASSLVSQEKRQRQVNSDVIEMGTGPRPWSKTDIRVRRRCKTKGARPVTRDDPHRMMIQNMVFTLDLGVSLSLSDIASQYHWFVEYNPARFAAVIMRLRSPVATLLLFGTGKGICTGCKSSWDLGIALTNLRDLLTRIRVCVPYVRSRVTNVVADASMGMDLDLNVVASLLPTESWYEPEIFPGLFFRPAEGGVTLLFFKSGSIVLTGNKSEAAAMVASRHVARVKALLDDWKGGEVHQFSKGRE